jgi:hypothetical protein
LRQAKERCGDPFDANSTYIKAMKIGMNPMPLILRKPMQEPRKAVGESIIIAGGVKRSATESQQQKS